MYQHIENLLANHDYVIVPGLGGFVVQKQSAIVLPGKIKAPFSTVSFNPLMQHADGLLAIEIARAEGITYRKAMELLETDVQNCVQTLNEFKYLNLGNIGVLEKDENANLIFTPPVNAAFIPTNIGLVDVYIAESNGLKQTKNHKVSITLPTTRTLKYVAAASLIFGMLLISPQLNDQKQHVSADLLSFSFVDTPKAIVADSVVEPCPELKESVSDSGEIVNNNKDLYHVVVASLPSKESADNYCSELVADNFECAHVLEKQKTFRVSIKSFENKDEAISYMENLRQTDERFETAWVLCKR